MDSIAFEGFISGCKFGRLIPIAKGSNFGRVPAKFHQPFLGDCQVEALKDNNPSMEYIGETIYTVPFYLKISEFI